jgi:hypothetical protein
MLSEKNYKEFSVVTEESDGFRILQNAITKSFADDKVFSEWVFSGGVNLFTYIKAIEDKKTVNELVEMIVSVIRPNLGKKELSLLKKDKTAYKFVNNWFKALGQSETMLSKLNKLPSGKRNLYSQFICLLLKYTTFEETN